MHFVSIVSSVWARKLKCPSSVWLGSEPSQLGLARVGKFQLEPISTVNSTNSSYTDQIINQKHSELLEFWNISFSLVSGAFFVHVYCGTTLVCTLKAEFYVTFSCMAVGTGVTKIPPIFADMLTLFQIMGADSARPITTPPSPLVFQNFLRPLFMHDQMYAFPVLNFRKQIGFFKQEKNPH